MFVPTPNRHEPGKENAYRGSVQSELNRRADRTGWMPVDESWVYASGTQVTVPSDATERFQARDKVKLVQSATTLYYVAGTVTATTIDLAGPTAVSNSDISQVFISREESPWGWPSGSFLQGYTGEIRGGVFLTAPPLWLLLDGKTIGDASSGATARANADTLALFTLLWNSTDDAYIPVSGGRGGSAAADFAAHKTIALPNSVGKMPIGKAASGTASNIGETGGFIDHGHGVKAHHHGMGTGADLNITSSGAVTGGVPLTVRLNATGLGAYEVAVSNGSGGSTVYYNLNSPNHTHPSGNVAGRIGLVTGGEDGNTLVASTTNNPPFVVVNWIISL